MKPKILECSIRGEEFETEFHNSRYCCEECLVDAKGYMSDQIPTREKKVKKKK